MRSIHRLSCIALLALAVSIGAAYGQPTESTSAGQPSAAPAPTVSQPDHTPAILDAIKEGVERITVTIDGLKQEPRNGREEVRADRNLAAQEEVARWAFWGIILTAVGLLLLAGTLWFTGRAAHAARNAVVEARKATGAAVKTAEEAKRQADLAEQSFSSLHRPYILPGGIVIVLPSDVAASKWPEIRFKIGNYGSIPAIIHYVDAIFWHEPLNPGVGPESGISRMGRNFNSGEIISPNSVRDRPLSFPLSGFVSIERKGKRVRLTYKDPENAPVFVIVYTKFEDPFGTIRRGRFTWKYDNSAARFLRYGGEEYNYEREQEWGAD